MSRIRIDKGFALAALVLTTVVVAAGSCARAAAGDADSTGAVARRDAALSSPVAVRDGGEAPSRASVDTTASAAIQTSASVHMAAVVKATPVPAAVPKSWQFDSDALARLAWDDGLQACISDGKLNARVRTVLVGRDETTSGPVMEFHVDPVTTGAGYVIRYDADSGRRLDD